MLPYLKEDFVQKATWYYGDASWKSMVKAVLTDGSLTMIAYRLSQTLDERHLGLVSFAVLKLNAVLSQSVIGRGAKFGPGFVVIHSTGVVINGNVSGGRNIFVEDGVTIGAEKNKTPILGDDIFIGAGAKIIGAVQVGSHVKIGANAVVVKDVPDHTTAVGVPARNRTKAAAEMPFATNAPAAVMGPMTEQGSIHG